MRWRARAVLNTLSSDLGFLSLTVGGLLYLSIIVWATLQSWSGGIVAREVSRGASDLGLRLLGIHLIVLVCFQAALLYFFRISLQGDFTGDRWRILPVAPRVLRRARLVDSLLNPGAVATLLATWLLVFGFLRPRTTAEILLCAALSPAFVYLSQGIFLVTAGLLNRFRSWILWTVLVLLAAGGLLLGVYFIGLFSGSTPEHFTRIFMSRSTAMVLMLPPWGVPVGVVHLLRTGEAGLAALLVVAAAAGGWALLTAGDRLTSDARRT